MDGPLEDTGKTCFKLNWGWVVGGLRRLVATPIATFSPRRFARFQKSCRMATFDLTCNRNTAQMTSPLAPFFSGTRTGHHELRCDQGAASAHHVVTARPVAEEERRGKHLHQKPRQIHRQQGSVRHVLRVWKHPVMQGITDKVPPHPLNVMLEVGPQFADRHKCLKKNKKTFSSISICP